MYTQKDMIKELRQGAKSLGLTFKRQNMTINNSQAYMFCKRITGEKVLSNCTLNSAYQNWQSGYLETLI